MRRKVDYDLKSAFEYNPQEGLTVEDIYDIRAEVPGEADGANWHWVAELCDGKFAYLVAGCAYTGCDCAGNLYCEIAETAIEAAMLAQNESGGIKSIQRQLIDQIISQQPFGLRLE